MSRGIGVIVEVKRLLLRLIFALVAAVMAAVVTAVAIAIVDLYLVGHGHTGILKDSIAWPAGIHLSVGDLVLLGAVLLAAAGGWILSGRIRY